MRQFRVPAPPSLPQESLAAAAAPGGGRPEPLTLPRGAAGSTQTYRFIFKKRSREARLTGPGEEGRRAAGRGGRGAGGERRSPPHSHPRRLRRGRCRRWALGGGSECLAPEPFEERERASQTFTFSLFFPSSPTMLRTPLPAGDERRLSPAPFS